LAMEASLVSGMKFPTFRTGPSGSGASPLLSTTWPAQLEADWEGSIKEVIGATRRTELLGVRGKYPMISKRTIPAWPDIPGVLASRAEGPHRFALDWLPVEQPVDPNRQAIRKMVHCAGSGAAPGGRFFHGSPLA